ncbi:hypothetical protein MFIFM68171_03504 [Madurella fahalii]|uniref:Uncharacterized protein n=1 Tax=Madurella fahalii TaxID=1157608 RepID=A0ABQ0G696_9PEZI
MAFSRSPLLPISLMTLLVTIDGAISLGLVSSMVAFLHGVGGGPFEVAYAGSTFPLAGEPANLVTDQGHTANGAGGTAVVLVGFGGLVGLLLERRSRKKHAKSSPFFYLWALITVLSALLSITALIYTFIETGRTRGSIDPAVAAQNPASAKYPDGRWTPENWYDAVLVLPLVNQGDRDVIVQNLRLMRGWRWNLIVLSILGVILAVLVLLELWRFRKAKKANEMLAEERQFSPGLQKRAATSP